MNGTISVDIDVGTTFVLQVSDGMTKPLGTANHSLFPVTTS